MSRKPTGKLVPDFPKEEDLNIQRWKDLDVFEIRRLRNRDGPCFTLYDGPPFAPAAPTFGQTITTIIKDVVSRYRYMQGYNVARLCGGQAHGLPILHQVLKELGLDTAAPGKTAGIGMYSTEYKTIADKTMAASTCTTKRLGACLSFCDNDKTMDPAFMETCWRLFKQLFDGGHVYRACRVMPYSTTLRTHMSHRECRKDGKVTFMKPAAVVSFPLVGVDGRQDTALLSYTLAPWTLPSNMLLGVDPELEYHEILNKRTYERYILGEGRFFSQLSSDTAKYEVIGKIPGKSMVGWKYKAPFEYFTQDFPDCFRVIAVNDLQMVEGTGVRHLAPAFSQRDFDAATGAGFLKPHQNPPCPLDERGCFTCQVPDFVGQSIHTANTDILNRLAMRSRLVLRMMVRCPDKVCRVTDKPVIRRTFSSWFIRVTDSIPGILENLEPTSWTPPSAKTAFKNRLATTHDWNIARDWYWGTPVPLWASDDFEEVVCIGSVEELRELSGFQGPLDAIHRAKVDSIKIPSKRGKGILRRVGHVFDPWFEAGCMPYVSDCSTGVVEYGGSRELLPADFIVRDLEDSRGWFYALVVLGHKLFNATPFRHAIVPGILRPNDVVYPKKIYAPPNDLFARFGADATRLYFIQSALMRGKATLMTEGGIMKMISQIMLPLWNICRLVEQHLLAYQKSTTKDLVAEVPIRAVKPANVMDRWALSHCQRLIQFVDREMREYRLHKIVPELRCFLQTFQNVYLRLNRSRLQTITSRGEQDTAAAITTLIQVLHTFARLLTPFAPCMAERIHQFLKPHLNWTEQGEYTIDAGETVFSLPFPVPLAALINNESERQLAALRSVLRLGRIARHRRRVPLSTPLGSLVVVADPQCLGDLIALKPYLRRDLNVAAITLSEDHAEYRVCLEARPDWRVLRKRFGENVKEVGEALGRLTQEQLVEYLDSGELEIDGLGVRLEEGDVTLARVLDGAAFPPGEEPDRWEAVADGGIVVLLEAVPTGAIVRAGVVREIAHKYQMLRAKAGVKTGELVDMRFRVLRNPGGVGLGTGAGGWWEVGMDMPWGRLKEVKGPGGGGEKDEWDGGKGGKQRVIWEEKVCCVRKKLVVRMQLLRV
ncbi:isoleucine--tRNA ligase, cytoplasmic [Staphylotrichum tortipilum]|uniref:isoleucine--tRNA ligase n=1 Tax=Staphylotrichum tortipilum TaxID=2831512 RepID=A0AAN6RTP7_9PEZI|nr:isoleucine--tRNA ligase, cytoplasmic [Staphylotrichum longicolle]